jgi:hypothetical protein
MSPLLSWELFIAIGIFIAIPMTRLYRQSRDGEDWSDTPDSVGSAFENLFDLFTGSC